MGPSDEGVGGIRHIYFSLEDKGRGVRSSGAKSTTSQEGKTALLRQSQKEVETRLRRGVSPSVVAFVAVDRVGVVEC